MSLCKHRQKFAYLKLIMFVKGYPQPQEDFAGCCFPLERKAAQGTASTGSLTIQAAD